MLLAYIYRSITHRVHFLDKASRDLFICAKDLFVGAMAALARGCCPCRVGGRRKVTSLIASGEYRERWWGADCRRRRRRSWVSQYATRPARGSRPGARSSQRWSLQGRSR